MLIPQSAARCIQRQYKRYSLRSFYARRIQRLLLPSAFKRLVQHRAIVSIYMKTGPPSALNCSFKDFVEFAYKQRVLAVVKRCLQFMMKQPVSDNQVRLFVAAYFIAHFTSKTFEEVRHLEQKLIDCSKAMLAAFYRHCRAPSGELEAKFVEYSMTYQAWKEVDAEKCKRRIIHGLKALYRIRAYTGCCVDCDNTIERQRKRLFVVAGTSGLEAFDEQHPLPLRRFQSNSCKNVEFSPFYVYPQKDEEVVHELLINPSFRFSDTFPPIQQILSDCFWAIIADDVQMGYLSKLKVLINDICQHSNRDPVVIQDMSSVLAFAGTDDLEMVCPALKAKVAAVRFDILQQLQNHADEHVVTLLQNGEEFLRVRFAEKVAAGQVSLDKTRAWVLGYPNMCKAFDALIIDPSLSLPETLALDANRIDQLRIDFDNECHTSNVSAAQLMELWQVSVNDSARLFRHVRMLNLRIYYTIYRSIRQEAAV